MGAIEEAVNWSDKLEDKLIDEVNRRYSALAMMPRPRGLPGRRAVLQQRLRRRPDSGRDAAPVH